MREIVFRNLCRCRHAGVSEPALALAFDFRLGVLVAIDVVVAVAAWGSCGSGSRCCWLLLRAKILVRSRDDIDWAQPVAFFLHLAMFCLWFRFNWKIVIRTYRTRCATYSCRLKSESSFTNASIIQMFLSLFILMVSPVFLWMMKERSVPVSRSLSNTTR